MLLDSLQYFCLSMFWSILLPMTMIPDKPLIKHWAASGFLTVHKLSDCSDTLQQIYTNFSVSLNTRQDAIFNSNCCRMGLVSSCIKYQRARFFLVRKKQEELSKTKPATLWMASVTPLQ